MEVIEEEKELVVDTKTTSVFEITKDLLEDGDQEEQLSAPSSQIDWNWGGDGFGDGDENENNNDDGSVDSDATEEIESDNEEEAEKDSSNDCENSGAEKGNDGEMKMDGNDDDVANAATESSSSASSSPKKEEQKKGADLQGVLDAEDSEGEEEELDILSSKDNDDVDNDSDAEDDDENSEDNSKDKPSSKDNTDDVSLDDDDSDDEASVGNALLDAADKALNDEEYDESLLLETQPPSPSIVKEGKAATTSDAAEDGNEDEDKNDSNETTMEVDDKEEQEEAEEPVLSQEEPEDTAAVDQEDEDSSTEELVVEKQEKKKGKKKKKSKSKQPDLDDLLRSTDYLYQHADQSEVTVKDIKQSLEAEYDCKLSKANSKKVREHLKDLINKKILASIAGDQEEESEPEPEEESEPEPEDKDDSDFEVEKPKKKNKKEQAGHEDSDAEESVVGQADESDSDDSEFEESLKDKKKKRKQSKPTKKKLTKPKPLGKRKAAKAARLIEAERLRKKRMDELRVRNEEMQLNISKEEQERSEKIAARLETNTDELRAKRLEDRLNLLQALDQKRIEVVEIKDKEPREPAASTPKLEQQEANAAVENEDSSSDEESSDEEEIEIVGIAKPLKPMKPIHTHFKSKALDILQKLRSPEVKKARKVSVSPGTSSMNARMALRQKLKEKQRTAGNRWLARELGYKTEKEHLKDCQTVINQKREQVVKFEQLRLKANERTQLRQRMLLGEEMPPNQEDDDGEEEYKPDEAENEEENEELRIARELEEERNGGQKSPEPSTVTPVANEKTTIGTSDDADMTNAEETQEAAANRKDGTLSESQPLETQPPLNATVLPASLTMQVSAEGSNFVTDETETEEPADGNQDASLETQTLETQPLPDIPEKERVALRIVSEESDDASPESLQGNGGTLSGNATEPESAETSPSPSQPEGEDDDAEGELEFVDDTPPEVTAEREEAKASAEPKKPRNAGWQAMLQREAEKLRKQKKRKNAGGLLEEEAEEEEEEEVAGLEDFGFSVKKKDKDGDEEDNANLELDEDDLKHVVDDVSDDEGDEDAGRKARQRQQEREEKERHKEMLRRMREGYDGRRGGIAGGAGARGLHRFDQLVAADNREDAKRLGLLNDDELDSDNEEEKSGDKDEEEDETALLDKMLKDRFLHRSDVDVEENFDSDDEEENPAAETEIGNQSDEEEERTQERLAKRFTKRARMQRMEEIYAESQEFSQQRMIDEDESMKLELQSMKVRKYKNMMVNLFSAVEFSNSFLLCQNGLLRKRSISSSRSSFSEQGTSSNLPFKRQRSTASNSSFFGGSVTDKSSGSLSIALRASRQIKRRTSFLGGAKAGASGAENNKDGSFAALNRVGLFNSRSSFSNSAFSKGASSVDETGNKRKERPGAATSTSLFGKVVGRQ